MMDLFAKWMIGTVLVATGAVSLGYGSGMMWRAWWTMDAQIQEGRAAVTNGDR